MKRVRAIALSLAFAIFALSADAHATDLRHRQCRLEFLDELGWQVAPAAVDSVQSNGGTPCLRASLGEAHAAGDLRLSVPLDTDAWLSRSTSAADLDAAIASPASICAFAIRLGDATRSAADKLIANPQFKFSGIQAGWIGFGGGSAADAGWKPIFTWGRGFIPAGSNSQAIDAFYRRPVRAECGVGRQVGQYAALAELFGPAGFDRAFKPEEIVVGTFNKLNTSQSVLLGSARGEMFADGWARKSSARGPQAFNGVPGFLVHVFDVESLSDINNQAQNFVVYDVDAAAGRALEMHGGFVHYNRLNRRIWELSEPFHIRGRRWFERLLWARDARLLARLTPIERTAFDAMRGLLDDPFYRGFRVYGHPHGVKPIGYFVIRMLDRNPRTPFQLELALHNLHTEIYQRYVRDRIGACRATDPDLEER